MIDLVNRIVDPVWILEDHLNIAAKSRPLIPRKCLKILALIEHLALGRRDYTKEQARKGGLAAATLPHQSRDRRRMGVNDEREIFERDCVLLPEQPPTIYFGDVPEFEQRCHAHLLNTGGRPPSDSVGFPSSPDHRSGSAASTSGSARKTGTHHRG